MKTCSFLQGKRNLIESELVRPHSGPLPQKREKRSSASDGSSRVRPAVILKSRSIRVATTREAIEFSGNAAHALPLPGERAGVRASVKLTSRELAFTRVELLAVLGALIFLAAVVLPALANNRPRSDRVICANNLRQIGMGFQLWGNDFNDQPPWEVPSQTPGTSSLGPGTMQHPLGVNAWLHYAWISNELNSARVLLCPSDSGRLADDFTANPAGGYLSANYRNNATSYFLTHAFSGGQFSMFAGDRNFQTPGGVAGCSRFPQVATAFMINLPGWDTGLHNQAGNIVRLDGRVNQYSNEQLRAAVVADPISDRDIQSALHILKPR